jgi:lipoprotein-releasing system ATP-binding protein
MTPDPVLTAVNLRKRFSEGDRDLDVLRGINIEVRRGERIAIVGLSGSGKSTLLHLLGGLDAADDGEVVVCGTSLSRLSQTALGKIRNRHLGFVYQFHHLLGDFSAIENVAMPLLIGGATSASAKTRAATMLAAVGLAERLRHRPGQLSGGERQRVAIARALVTMPDCVLADEPTGNLDEQTSADVDDLMIRLSRDFQTSFVVVTHNRDLATRMDRVYRLHNGLLEETG